MESIRYQWADLPRELLENIGKCLDSGVDVLRLRSVCSSWRSSVPSPSFDQEIPPLLVKLPRPIAVEAVVSQSTICRLELQPQKSTSSSVSQVWLTKIAESRRGKLQVLHPISNHHQRYSGMLNLEDLRFVPLSKAFTLKTSDGCSIIEINKVLLFPISATYDNNEYAIVAIYHEGKLGYWKNGDKQWTLLDDRNFEYDDIILYKGQFYVVDRWGTVSWIDSSLKVIQYSPPLYGCGGRKHLVESRGDLYIVDRYLDGKRNTWNEDETAHYNNPIRRARARRFRKRTPKAVDFRVYRLDEEWGRWVDVKSLGDRVFVLGIDCSFSVSSEEFAGGKGNCVYFTDDDYYVERGSICVFRLVDRSIERLASLPQCYDIFSPPQHWLDKINQWLPACSTEV